MGLYWIVSGSKCKEHLMELTRSVEYIYLGHSPLNYGILIRLVAELSKKVQGGRNVRRCHPCQFTSLTLDEHILPG